MNMLWQAKPILFGLPVRIGCPILGVAVFRRSPKGPRTQIIVVFGLDIVVFGP